ncbi:MAG: methyltransferase [Acidobacteriota bacterium]|nr:methyltransferase [Acidobacteriota bacterium]
MLNRIKDFLGMPQVWEYGQAAVFYRPDLDGGGRDLAPCFVDFLWNRLHGIAGAGRRVLPFENALEWCAGPGFIGFSLVAAGLCKRLCLVDINPAARPYAERTIRKNRLQERVQFVVSDNLRDVPAQHFDLIVANPPNYFGLNPQHPYYERFKDDLRPNDRGWKVHRAFYSQANPYLSDGAILLISEIDPARAEVRTSGFDVPYDIRPRPALEDFKEMIQEAGLEYVGSFPLCTLPGGFRSELVISVKPPRLGSVEA